MRLILFVLFLQMSIFAQAVTVEVNAGKAQGPYHPVYRYFGYYEPKFTYMPNGRKLLGELARLSADPVYVRTHFLLATGDGTPALKWGSTNAYTETADGKAVYDWTIIDKIFDAYRDAGVRPFCPRSDSCRRRSP